MTVSSTENRKEYAGNGATTSFATTPVVFFVGADLTLYVVNDTTGAVTSLTLNTHYTVTGGDGAVGTVDLAGGSSPYGAPATGTTLVIVRDLAITQAVDFVNNDSSDAEVAEDALDRLTMIAQQLDARIDRSFVLADSDTSGASTIIPTPVASKLIGWNSAGTALQNYAAIDFGTALVSAFMLTVIDDVDAATARATLDVPSNSEAILDTIIAAKGDLIVGTANDTPAILTVGANNTILVANSAEATGVKWAVLAASDTVPGLIEIATQVEQETAADGTRAVTPASQQYHPSSVKGWCRASITGTAVGSYNVTSVTDGGVGDVTVNWTTAFSALTYSVVVSAKHDAPTTHLISAASTGHAVGASRALSQNSATTATDPDEWFFMACGDQ